MAMLPIYNAKIADENDGIIAVSLVEDCAVEIDFQMFKKANLKYAVEDEEKHLLLGVVMRCDYNIYRITPDGYEYFIRYDRQTIETMAKKMLKDDTFKNIDLQHDGNILPEGAVELVQLFIKDTDKGIVPTGFDEVSDGSLFAVYKVNDEDVWNMCKDATFRGFSLEGFFTVEEDQKFSKKINKLDTMKNKIKEMLKKMLMALGAIEAEDGTVLNFDGEVLEVGTAVTNDEGNAIADGEYTYEGNVYTVAEGVVTEIKPVEDEATEETTEETTEEEVEAEDEESDEAETTTETTEETTDEETTEEETTEDDVETLKKKIEDLMTEIDTLKKELEEIKKEPAADTVVEEFEKKTKSVIKNNKLAKAIAFAEALK